MSRVTQRERSAAAIWSGLIVVSVLLLSRRLAEDFAVTSPAVCVVMSSLSTLLSILGWFLFRSSRTRELTPPFDWAVAVVAWLPTWLTGAALLPPGPSFAIGWLTGLAGLSGLGFAVSMRWISPSRLPNSEPIPHAIIGETTSVPSAGGGTRHHSAALACERSVIEDLKSSAAIIQKEPELAVFPTELTDDAENQTTQWMTRQKLADGTESIEGSIRVPFESGQRLASVHVGFTPPFDRVPTATCEVASDDAVRWKVSVIFTYGMRIELKRDASPEPSVVELSYSALCETANAEAA